MHRTLWRNVFPELGADAVGIGFSDILYFLDLNIIGCVLVDLAGAFPIVFFSTGEKDQRSQDQGGKCNDMK